MIGAHYLVEDERRFNLFQDLFTDHEIIDPPPDIFCTGTEALTPESILDFITIKLSKGIGKTGRNQIVEPVNFLLCVSRCLVVIRFRPCKIYGFVGNIKVTGDDNRFFRFKAFKKFQEILIP